MYIKDDIPFCIVPFGPAGLEIIFVSVLLSNNRRVCLGTFYRPPSDNVDIVDTLFNSLCLLNSSLFSNLILLGDFNVNYLDSTSSLYTLLHSIISSFHLTVVQEPTRVVENGSATLIDLAFLSNPSCCEECSVIPPLSKL